MAPENTNPCAEIPPPNAPTEQTKRWMYIEEARFRFLSSQEKVILNNLEVVSNLTELRSISQLTSGLAFGAGCQVDRTGHAAVREVSMTHPELSVSSDHRFCLGKNHRHLD